MRNVSDKGCRKIQNTHFMFNDFFFLENLVIYEIIWKNVEEPARQHMAIWHIPLACWIPKVTNIHSEYVILVAFLLHQWLHERATMLHYTYVAYLVVILCHFCGAAVE
jgi:hypothetical protein